MDAIEAILSRRSIRKYENKPVPPDLVNKLLECAMAAPSASNGQPWHFVAIDSREKLNEMTQHHPYAAMLKEATLAIIVCGDLNSKNPNYWQQDCSAATENILLAARALGLGTCWCAVYPNETRTAAFKQIFGLPENIMPMNVIAVGYPNEQKPPANRYSAERVHKNSW